MNGVLEGDKSLPVQMIWEGIEPFVRQATFPSLSQNDRSAIFPGVRRLFSYAAPAVSFSPSVKKRWYDGNFAIEEIEYQTGPLTRATAFTVRPKVTKADLLPALLLFHCHSGIYRWGKEKVLATSEDRVELRDFRQLKYDGHSLAHDLANRGFLVMIPDAFYFGSRALGREGIDASPAEMNQVRKNSEQLIAKMLLVAGHSWPALIGWEDRRALDYLCSLPNVDRNRIGCLGLSFGGFRSVMLAAQDRRIIAAITAGWLTTMEDLLKDKIRNHSWMVLPGGMLPDLDLPMIAANAYPAALLALLCTRDHLFTLKGMEAASDTLTSYYRQAGGQNRCGIQFFDSPHGMTEEMQGRATQWMERFLCQDMGSVAG